jgi:hypothetical protein
MKMLVEKVNMTFWDSTFWQNYAEIPVAQDFENSKSRLRL